MQTALLVGGKAQVAILSPAAARSLGFLDPATGTVLPIHRSQDPKNLIEKVLGLSNDANKIREVHLSIAGREMKIVAVVEEMIGTSLAGEEYIVLPSSLVHCLGVEGIVHSKVIKKMVVAPLSNFELALIASKRAIFKQNL